MKCRSSTNQCKESKYTEQNFKITYAGDTTSTLRGKKESRNNLTKTREGKTQNIQSKRVFEKQDAARVTPVGTHVC